MKSWRAKALLVAGAGTLLAALPALGQDRDQPKSLLPPGFGDTQNLPLPEEKAAPQTRPQQTPQPTAPGPTGNAAEPEIGGNALGDVEEVQLDQAALPRPTNYFAIPEGTARPTDVVGALGPANFGLGEGAFGTTNGPLYAALMQRLDAPLPSRWASILLRRALLSRVAVPPGVQPVDWVAERAALLLRMGEADAARMLVQAVDVEQYTPRMVEVAAQTALATADPAALCPLVAPARSWSNDPVWILADGMCAALEGESARATALIDQARDQAGTGIDLLLAEKVVGAGAETRRAVDIQWEGVDAINPWRFGLASAVGLAIPDRLMNNASPQIWAYLARAPMVPLDQRLQAASVAASLGVFSSHSMVELYSLVLDQTDPNDVRGSLAERLRSAWVDPDVSARMAALRNLWTDNVAPQERYARSILTAGAAARIPPSAELIDDTGALIAAMLSAGMDREAARWAGVVDQAGEGGRAWALLAVGAPTPVVGDRLDAFVSADDSPGQLRSQLLAAALAGLGRIGADQAAGAGFRPAADDVWTAALDRAARERAPGAVALLAAVGMQTQSWRGITPAYLFRIVRALRAVGLEYEARMIAAEAVARL
ncbi:MAG: hypothetical protein QOH47_1131 [Sphingomonadales bacterium]|jgi:hypothetical protein|nr:hypothetical protein [Sphingomonadales bacterium]